jgi:hypothetical protein
VPSHDLVAIHVLLMNITKLDAAKSQLATAIRLYFEDCDPVSVHTLALAASEIIDRLCVSKGTPAMRSSFLEAIIPGRRKEFADSLNKARNFFKHASSSKPNEILEDFSDEQNLIGIIMAADGLRLLGVEMLDARIFTAWVSVMEPELMLVPPPKDLLALFADLHNQPRAAQKQSGRDVLRNFNIARMGLSPDAAKDPL